MKNSAGILLYKTVNKRLEVLLVHPGGPYWKKKEEGAWTIPKGEFQPDENPLEAAKRELEEETGYRAGGNFLKLTPIKQKSGKLVLAWAMEGDFNTENLVSNEFEIEWPPRSGKKQKFPEVDRAEWFPMEEAKNKINPGQVPLITELQNLL